MKPDSCKCGEPATIRKVAFLWLVGCQKCRREMGDSDDANAAIEAWNKSVSTK